jgi:glycosyltransferase involved in cell wall biosynthesis
MKVSVIIPAYNEEARISRVIEAVCAQEYDDFEIIVVNNASTDATEEIARRFPITVVSETRKGTSSARECGRCHATGEIIANVDADCMPQKGWLTCGVRHFENPKVVAVSGPYDYYDAPFFLRTFLWLGFIGRWLLVTVTRLPSFEYGGSLVGGNMLIRSSALAQAGGYDTSLVFFGDEASTIKRIIPYGKIVFSMRLVMKTSARRFMREGVWSLSRQYLRNMFGKKE